MEIYFCPFCNTIQERRDPVRVVIFVTKQPDGEVTRMKQLGGILTCDDCYENLFKKLEAASPGREDPLYNGVRRMCIRTNPDPIFNSGEPMAIERAIKEFKRTLEIRPKVIEDLLKNYSSILRKLRRKHNEKPLPLPRFYQKHDCTLRSGTESTLEPSA